MSVKYNLRQNLPKNLEDIPRLRPQLATRTGHKTSDRCSDVRPKSITDKIRADVEMINSGSNVEELRRNELTISENLRELKRLSDQMADKLLMAKKIHNIPSWRFRRTKLDEFNRRLSQTNSSLRPAEDHNYGSSSKKEESPDSEIEEVMNKWWTKTFDERKGDSNKVLEINLTEDQDMTPGIIELKPDEWDCPKYEYKPIVRPMKKKAITELTEQKKRLCISIPDPIEREKKEANDLFKRQEKKVIYLNEILNETSAKHLAKTIKNPLKTVVTKICKPTDYYFCIFCTEVFDNSLSAKDHYLAHLGLYLECRECHQKFTSLQTFRKHNPKHMDRSKMLNLEQFMAAKKWTDNYIDNYIERHEDLIKCFMFTYHMFCPICHRVRQTYDEKDLKSNQIDVYVNKCKVKFTEEFMRNHLYEHFQYFPFECIDCQLEDRKTEFCLNDKARQHLLDVHNVENAFDFKINKLKAYFNLRKPIKRLEVCVEECLSISMKLIRRQQKRASKVDRTKLYKPGS